MVNGTTSRLLYIGAYVVILVCLGSILALKLNDAGAAVPTEVDMVLTSSIAFVLGAHIKPPIATDANGGDLDPDQKAA